MHAGVVKKFSLAKQIEFSKEIELLGKGFFFFHLTGG